MRFTETKVKGAFLIDLERREDHRGFFARSWCAKEFEAHGLNSRLVQINVGYTAKRAGIRGMHYQLRPHEEAKTVRCTQGAVFDVVVDLRPHSPTFKLWDAFELTGENRRALYMGRGIATQLVKPLPGIRLAAVANRTVSKAEQALRDSGLQHFHRAATVGQIEMAISAGKVAVTDDPLLLCDASNIDVVVDA